MFDFHKLSSRHILHIDGDSFFASCEVAVNPALRGKAVVTGKERGIASAMTYEAKAKGVTRGMPVFRLKKMFPDVTVISSDYELYSLFSRRMINIVRRYSDSVHEYSIDECFADITSIVKERGGDALSVARAIKHDLQNELGLTFSLGLASTKVLAKIASKTQKPNGLTLITHENRKEFLRNVPIQKVWGIGRETSSLLFSHRLKTALDFAESREDIIKSTVAKPYYEIFLELNGIASSISDFASAEEREASKSISRTRTFSPSSTDPKVLYSELSNNAEEACAALRREGLVACFMSFFLKDRDFRYYRYEAALPHRTSSPEEVLEIVRANFKKIYRKGVIYRASGVTLMNVRDKERFTPDLFGAYLKVEARKGLYEAIDALLRKQRSDAVYLGSSFRARKHHNDREDKRESFIADLPFPYLGEVS